MVPHPPPQGRFIFCEFEARGYGIILFSIFLRRKIKSRTDDGFQRRSRNRGLSRDGRAMGARWARDGRAMGARRARDDRWSAFFPIFLSRVSVALDRALWIAMVAHRLVWIRLKSHCYAGLKNGHLTFEPLWWPNSIPSLRKIGTNGRRDKRTNKTDSIISIL